jgi:TnpA family transposase
LDRVAQLRQLIEAHYADGMRVVLSVQEGKISSITLLQRLSTYSRRNNIYKAFHEIGRAIRTVQPPFNAQLGIDLAAAS